MNSYESFWTLKPLTITVTPSPASICNAPSRFKDSIWIFPWPFKINVDLAKSRYTENVYLKKLKKIIG